MKSLSKINYLLSSKIHTYSIHLMLKVSINHYQKVKIDLISTTKYEE